MLTLEAHRGFLGEKDLGEFTTKVEWVQGKLHDITGIVRPIARTIRLGLQACEEPKRNPNLNPLPVSYT
jgi:hypothetical protein